MSSRRGAFAPLVYLSLLFLSVTGTFVAGQSPVKGGYYVGGTSTLLPVSGLNTSLYTHLFYSSVTLVNNTSCCAISSSIKQEMSTFSSNMKRRNPDVLTLISISVTGLEFKAVLQSNQSQQEFINSSISEARLYQFDGIDLDWEFAGSQEEMDSFGLLIAAWRQAVNAEGKNTSRPPLLLTAAVYFNSTIVYTGTGSYPITAIAENLDFVNVMTYDYHGPWPGGETQTGANTNLYDPSSIVSTDRGIMSWLDAGMPPKKLVLGLTLYGRSWMLKDQASSNGLGAAAIAAGPPQTLSQSAGIFYYSEVVPFIAANDATVVHNMTDVTGYCYANNIWVSYEDPFIIGNKVLYLKNKGLRGYFFWAVSQDDDFEVSTAASQTFDSGILPISPASAPSPSGAGTASVSVAFVVVALLSSVLLLLRCGTIDTVG